MRGDAYRNALTTQVYHDTDRRHHQDTQAATEGKGGSVVFVAQHSLFGRSVSWDPPRVETFVPVLRSLNARE